MIGAVKIDRSEALRRAEATYRDWHERCLAANKAIYISNIPLMEAAIADAIEGAVRETAAECANIAGRYETNSGHAIRQAIRAAFWIGEGPK